MPNIPWIGCDNWWNDERCIQANNMMNVSSHLVNVSSLSVNNSMNISWQSTSEQFFYNYVLEMSSGVDDPNGMNYKVAAALFFCWIMAFFALIKGISSLGKVSYFTAIFPYIMITILIIRGVTLDGAMKGLEFYILTVDMAKLLTLQTWIDASSQALFCLGIAQGSLLTLGKHNSFNYNHQKATFIIALLDGFTGVYAGFAIFSVLGFMAESTGKEVSELAVGGLGLSFIVYPEALSLMPFPWIWCIFFFMMMITIGFGSLLSMTECCLDTFTSILEIPKKHNTKVRFGFCMFFFFMGLTMTTRGGYYLVNLIDNYTCTIPIIFLATLEAVGLGWFYGIKRIDANIRLMLGVKLNLYWKICYQYITPVIAIIMLGITFVCNTEVKLGDYIYPRWAHNFGYFVVCTCLCPLFICGAKQMHDAGIFEIIYDLMQPSQSWKPAFDDGRSISETSSENDSQGSKKGKKPIHDYTEVKMEKINENSNQQIIFQNSEDED